MGLFDKVKQEIGKVTDNAKKLVEGAKEVRNTPDIEGVTSWGSIYGENFPKSPKGEKVRYDFDFDVKNLKFIVFYTIHGNFKDKYKLIAEYSFDDIVEFKLEKIKESDYASSHDTSYYHNITLASGEVLSTYHSFLEKEKEMEYNIRNNGRSVLNLGWVYNVFSGFDKITDENTKQVVNEFYTSRGSNPLFDENGEFCIDNDAFKILCDRNDARVKEQLKSLQ